MYLKRLEIHGFKSFAQKTTMEFSQGIIAIVGPNGSGKSNVADSLRWVLGEQSAKLIRGKSSQDVIFAGSEKKTKMGFAEVFATFDNRDRRIPVDAAEVSIGRRIDRSGESEYLINGNKVRLLDIVDLVLKSNIGTSRYTVIGQGTIDQMVLAGPAEVKNLLDEASGVKTYYIKREKTLRRLEQTAQNLMRAEDLIAEIEPRLKSLRRQAKRMEARAEIEQELKLYQREYFGKTYWGLRTVIEKFEQQLAGLDGQRLQLEQKILESRKQAEGFEAADGERSARFRNIQDQLGQLQNQKNKVLEDLSMVRGKMQSQKTIGFSDAGSIQVELHQRNQRIETIQSKISAAKQEQAAVHQQSEQRKMALAGLNEKLESVYAIIQNPISVDWVAFDRELVGIEKSFQSFYDTLQHVTEIGQVRPMADELKNSFTRFSNIAKNNISDPQLHVQAAQQEMQSILKQKEELQAEMQRQELELSRATLSLEFLEKEISAVEQDRHHLELELKKAESTNFDDFVQSMIGEEKKIQEQADVLTGEINRITQLFREEQEEDNKKQKALHETESEYRKQQDELSKLKDRISGLQIEKAKYDTQMSVLAEEVRRILGEEIFKVMQEGLNTGEPSVAEGSPVSPSDLEGRIVKLKNQLDMIGGMDELTLKEYQETETRYTNLSTQVSDLRQGIQDLRSVMDELDEHIKSKFNESFHKINERFEYYFRVLFNGGRAYLSVLRSEDEARESAEQLSEDQQDSEPDQKLRPEEKIVKKYEKGVNNVIGIDIKATPPNKKLASIQALSGGERALTSIALLCSLLTCFPSPFVVLDEVDAALDDANTIRFGQILGTLAHQTQFITITHNRETMAQSSILYGVTMGDDGMSKLLSVKLEQAKQYAK
jgi:chromosome segregation protein